MKAYEKWLDGSFDPDENFDLEAWCANHRDRIMNTAIMAKVAAEIPRRLGANATPHELGVDKRFAKKLANVLIGVLAGQWRDAGAREELSDRLGNLQLDDPLRPAAAQVDWFMWLEELTNHLRSEASYIAVNLHDRKDYKSANIMTHRLEQELAQVANLYERVHTPAEEN